MQTQSLSTFTPVLVLEESCLLDTYVPKRSVYSLWGVAVRGFVIAGDVIVQVRSGASQLLWEVRDWGCIRGGRHVVHLRATITHVILYLQQRPGSSMG